MRRTNGAAAVASGREDGEAFEPSALEATDVSGSEEDEEGAEETVGVVAAVAGVAVGVGSDGAFDGVCAAVEATRQTKKSANSDAIRTNRERRKADCVGGARSRFVKLGLGRNDGRRADSGESKRDAFKKTSRTIANLRNAKIAALVKREK